MQLEAEEYFKHNADLVDSDKDSDDIQIEIPAS
jgi:hypothetical protein